LVKKFGEAPFCHITDYNTCFAYAHHRQLPNKERGAYRLLINLEKGKGGGSCFWFLLQNCLSEMESKNLFSTAIHRQWDAKGVMPFFCHRKN
jgi:hypothetical protein